MTIAAGFRVANGILIGADTRIEEGNVKYEQNKVFDCHESGTNCAVLLAGAGNFESISYCADLLRTHGFLGSTDHLHTLKERVLKFLETKRYRRLIERQAPYGGFPRLWPSARVMAKPTDLLSLSGECLYPIPEFRCIGAGSETALFISKWRTNLIIQSTCLCLWRFGFFAPLKDTIRGATIARGSSGCTTRNRD